MFRFKALSLAVIVVLMFTAASHAASVFVDESDFEDSRSAADGQITTHSDWSNDGLKLSWDISETGGVFTYVYTVTSDDDSPLSKGVSHTIFETSTDFGPGDILDGSSGNIEEPGTTEPGFTDENPSKSNPMLPGDIYGINFDFGSTSSTYTLVTTRRPIWGDFYLKGGNSSAFTPPGPPAEEDFLYAYNAGFGTDPTQQTSDFSNWIATPDTATATVPTPAAAGAGLVLFVGLALRRGRYAERR